MTPKRKNMNAEQTAHAPSHIDEVAFGDGLVDSALARRSKTRMFISDAQLEDILADCMLIRRQGITTESIRAIRRRLDGVGYLAVAGNRIEFLEMLGLTPQAWDRCQHLPEPEV